MKLYSLLPAMAIIIFSALGGKNSPSASTSLYEHKWELRKIYTDSADIANDTRAYIRFHEQKKSAGGIGGCNVFGSTIAVNGHSLRFSDIIATRMYCEGVQDTEDLYLKQLEKVTRFAIRDSRLYLYGPDKLLLEFEKD